MSDESLRRFDVRWVIAVGHSPVLGDPIGEVQLGTYYIRELKGWDGKFARVEKGTGEVKTTRLDDREVDVEVTGTEPVLVALGTGYYPRWRATHASGADEPVYALPATPTGTLHVVAAWLKPGKTAFTVDGPLPSDGDGRWLAIAAALVAIAIVIVWSRRRWRYRVLRRMARLRPRVPALLTGMWPYAVASLLAMLAVRGCVVTARPALHLEIGNGLRGTATVEARTGEGPWATCGYEHLAGDYRCDDVVTVYDGMANILNDAPPSWAFSTPSIVAIPDAEDVHIRVRMSARLAGSYWAGVSENSGTLQINDRPYIITKKTTLDVDDHGDRDLELEAPVSSSTGIWAFTMVRVDTLQPDRPYLAALPPLAPPP